MFGNLTDFVLQQSGVPGVELEVVFGIHNREACVGFLRQAVEVDLPTSGYSFFEVNLENAFGLLLKNQPSI